MTVKRITYLTRRADLTPEQFSAHWSTVHAEIARDLPRVVAYRQNHLARPDEPRTPSPPDTSERWELDGIVELWFEDAEAAAAGFGSAVADRLIVDERRFLSGLVGGAVDAPAPPTEQTGKLWLLWEAVPVARDEVDADVAALAAALGARSAQVNVRQDEAPVLSRDDLRRQDLPALAVAFSFASVSEARGAGEAVRSDPRARGAQVLVAEEVPII